MAPSAPSSVSHSPTSANFLRPISNRYPKLSRPYPMRRTFIAVTSLLALAACGSKHPDQASRSPQESLRSIQVLPGFKVELFASEPLVFDPVEMVFDENGRMFVAEMLD